MMDRDTFTNLVDRHLDGGLDNDQQQSLERAIQEQPELRPVYWELAGIHTQLRTEMQIQSGRAGPLSMSSESPILSRPSPPSGQNVLALKPREKRILWLRPLLAAAALIAIVISAVMLFEHSTTKPAHETVATLVHTHDAIWEDGATYTIGSSMHGNTLHLKSGLAQLRFDNGATMILEGPTQLQITDVLHAALHHGRISAHIPETAHGFTVSNPRLTVVDLGTEFGLAIDNKSGEVHVFDGAVQARAGDHDGALPHQLQRGEASQVADDGTLTTVPYDDNAFVRVMPQEIAAADLTRDLVAWYPLDETAGDVVHDNSGNGHNGRVVNGSVEKLATAGRIKGAFHFSDHAHVEILKASDFTLNNLTIHAWVKPDVKQSADGQIMSKQGSYGLALPDNTSMKFYFWHTDRVAHYEFKPQQWVNLIATYDGTVRRFYVNGVRIATISSPAPPVSLGLLRIGALTSKGQLFRGDIDDVRLYRRALTESEVRLLYLSAGPTRR